MMRAILAALLLCVAATSASAHPRHHRHHHVYQHTRARYGDARPSAWCGWYLRQVLGVRDRSYNLARNWAHWGANAGGPQIGAVVVWPHHVGRIVGREGGRWIVNSGNDGHAVRTRARSLAGAIAFRVAGWGGWGRSGVASYYNRGRRTANGERFNPHGYTAASRTLPFGTRVRVTNPRNGRSVVVRINDRGPFVRGRDLDLAEGAARAIGMGGLARVSWQVVSGSAGRVSFGRSFANRQVVR